MAEYQLKAKEQGQKFSTVDFLDRVILDPIEIAPDGLFEKDIVLSREQAQLILEKRFGIDQTNSDVAIQPLVSKWPLPILYTFDGAHCKNFKEDRLF